MEYLLFLFTTFCECSSCGNLERLKVTSEWCQFLKMYQQSTQDFFFNIPVNNVRGEEIYLKHIFVQFA